MTVKKTAWTDLMKMPSSSEEAPPKTGILVRNTTASTVVSTPLPLDSKPHLQSCVKSMESIKI